MSDTNSIRYRRDIDGLRALAVLPVVLYHAGVPGVSGGFVGVDIFFVISGYLITQIIDRESAAGTFSIVRFYERRARRIFPALFFVLLLSLLVSSVVLMPRAFAQFGMSMATALGFVSNVYFWNTNSNYFADPTETMPLLHTWSLSVEEQFYLLFPWVFLLVVRQSRRALMPAMVCVALLSLAISVWGVRNAPTATFFLTPFRAWELLIGSMLAVTVGRAVHGWSRAWVEAAGIAGLLMILYSLVGFSGDTAFPGESALLPCVGAALLIFAGGGKHGSAVSALLSLGPIRFVGLISYSLYLVHWPVLVLARHAALGRELAAHEIAALIGASFVLAAFSWKCVEAPFRNRTLLVSRKAVFSASALATAVFLVSGLAASHSHGWPQRFPGMERVEARKSEPLPGWAAFPYRACFVQNAAQWGGEQCFLHGDRAEAPNLLLLGDSHAAHYIYGLYHLSADLSVDVAVFTLPGCPPIRGYDQPSNPQCARNLAEIPRVLAAVNPDRVVLAANWSGYLSTRKVQPRDIAETVQSLIDAGVAVTVLGPTPGFAFHHPDEYFYAAFGADPSPGAFTADSTRHQRNTTALRQVMPAGAQFVAPADAFCAGQRCTFRDGRQFLFADAAHLSEAGSLRAARLVLGRLGLLEAEPPGEPLQ